MKFTTWKKLYETGARAFGYGAILIGLGISISAYLKMIEQLNDRDGQTGKFEKASGI